MATTSSPTSSSTVTLTHMDIDTHRSSFFNFSICVSLDNIWTRSLSHQWNHMVSVLRVDDRRLLKEADSHDGFDGQDQHERWSNDLSRQISMRRSSWLPWTGEDGVCGAPRDHPPRHWQNMTDRIWRKDEWYESSQSFRTRLTMKSPPEHVGITNPVLYYYWSVSDPHLSLAPADRAWPFEHTQPYLPTYLSDTQVPLWSLNSRNWRHNIHDGPVLVSPVNGTSDQSWEEVGCFVHCECRFFNKKITNVPQCGRCL
jgi:hypothetical protein